MIAGLFCYSKSYSKTRFVSTRAVSRALHSKYQREHILLLERAHSVTKENTPFSRALPSKNEREALSRYERKRERGKGREGGRAHSSESERERAKG